MALLTRPRPPPSKNVERRDFYKGQTSSGKCGGKPGRPTKSRAWAGRRPGRRSLHDINEPESDRRGIKDGWYALNCVGKVVVRLESGKIVYPRSFGSQRILTLTIAGAKPACLR